MALQPRIIAYGNSVVALAMVVRFLSGPSVMAAASIAISLRGSLLRIAIVHAALPQGIVPFVFAKEYDVHPDILSTGYMPSSSSSYLKGHLWDADCTSHHSNLLHIARILTVGL
ncbi:hypothetical protein ZIOFF_050957 [Zingiber officinale]|uniref:Auxin efflux carrier component n=1 Tax=Zingiber officinale TaxID=94328 RepID=A0A8J5FQN2_ZINOF|nr:hypothetical protein ZIOFF_050957 [Zingiber officinale]